MHAQVREVARQRLTDLQPYTQRMRPLILILALAACFSGGRSGPLVFAEPREDVLVDSAMLMMDLEELASDAMQGRRAGTEGNAMAREYVTRGFEMAGLQRFGDSFHHPFSYMRRDSTEVEGVNVVGWVGGESSDRVVLVIAHYDHVGVRNGEIYNGADDNASGTAALLALAQHFAFAMPRHTVVFAALDAEEEGLRGARAFVADPPLDLDAVAVVVNMDMISRNEANELYVAGTSHYPQLSEFVDSVAAVTSINLIKGHDTPVPSPRDDWTNQSDHGAFHAVGIPFLYFGVEDHPGYHQPTDTADAITPAFYIRAASAVIMMVEVLDRNLERITR